MSEPVAWEYRWIDSTGVWTEWLLARTLPPESDFDGATYEFRPLARCERRKDDVGIGWRTKLRKGDPSRISDREPVLWIDTDELERVRKSSRDVWLPAYIGPNYENATHPLYSRQRRMRDVVWRGPNDRRTTDRRQNDE